MRDIKFRAWHKRGLVMEEVISFHVGHYVETICDDKSISEHPEQYDWGDCELMQYTGLQDKNGVEIYEGDIIQIFDDRGQTPTEVIFENAQFIAKRSIHTLAYDVRGRFVEVIGNIYEQPEGKS